jgi:hypothetical protein
MLRCTPMKRGRDVARQPGPHRVGRVPLTVLLFDTTLR